MNITEPKESKNFRSIDDNNMFRKKINDEIQSIVIKAIQW